MGTLCECVCLGIGWYGACSHMEPCGAVMHVQHEGFWGGIFGMAVWGSLLVFVSCEILIFSIALWMHTW